MRLNVNSVSLPSLLISVLFSCSPRQDEHSPVGGSEIMTWQDGKAGAISLTYDDATINQFRQAIPIMDSLGFKGTFFINTGDIRGSEFPPKFIGRPLAEIISASSKKMADNANLFERATAVRFLDIPGAIDMHNRIGSLFEEGKLRQAYKITDSAFMLVRKKQSYREVRPVLLSGELITWKEIKQFASKGHEFGNHTISHPRLAVLDEANLLYELEKCKEELLHQLGPLETFSAECPFGTENERVMKYAFNIHPALRNRMPEPFLKEINRSSDVSPVDTLQEYVQWQRGPLKKTTVAEMKGWVDAVLHHKNIWLVLTFHGVDNVGWEAKPHQELKEYFAYMKNHEDKLWVATFRDVTKYMRERMNSTIATRPAQDTIILTIRHTLDTAVYNLPLTLKTYVEPTWKKVAVRQGGGIQHATTKADRESFFVIYQGVPTGAAITLTKE